MKRDWNLIREILLEIEAQKSFVTSSLEYGETIKTHSPEKNANAILLWESHFIKGIDITTDVHGKGLMSPELTWDGHDLLVTIESKPVWERIKSTAQDKGIELSFDAVKALGKIALAAIIGG